jgi:hypothetical protein
MTGITTYLSVLTLNVNRLNSQNGLKRKIQQFVAYRRPISQTEINIGLGRKAGRRFTNQWPTKTGRSRNTYL